ncbi:MAG TPA: SgcJ/EcaC family oxidoreductase [Caulobacteraceae bacterium]|nr:SgcJ/EcaC family oxidoreductase [Caulobacteraceae bacterium]
MTDPASEAARSILAEMREGWLAGNGARFAATLTDDADYINPEGLHFHGREAIAAWQDSLLHGHYAGSRPVFDLIACRRLTDDVAHLVVDTSLAVPGGPRAGLIRGKADAVMVRQDGAWKVAAFHNSRVVEPVKPI